MFLGFVVLAISAPVYVLVTFRHKPQAAAQASAIGAAASYVLSVMFRFDAIFAAGMSGGLKQNRLNWRIGVSLAVIAVVLAVTSIVFTTSRLSPGAQRTRFVALSSTAVILIGLADALYLR